MLAEAVYSVITQMNDDIYMLPTPLIMFFKAAQDQLNDKGLHASHNCLAIKVGSSHAQLLLERKVEIRQVILLNMFKCSYVVQCFLFSAITTSLPRQSASPLGASFYRNLAFKSVFTLSAETVDSKYTVVKHTRLKINATL